MSKLLKVGHSSTVVNFGDSQAYQLKITEISNKKT
jgi:hypothetical protein